MQLPAWVHSGNEVCYVYEEKGQRKMEVYSVSPDTFERLRTCDYNLERTHPLPKFISQWLDRKRKSLIF